MRLIHSGEREHLLIHKIYVPTTKLSFLNQDNYYIENGNSWNMKKKEDSRQQVHFFWYNNKRHFLLVCLILSIEKEQNSITYFLEYSGLLLE